MNMLNCSWKTFVPRSFSKLMQCYEHNNNKSAIQQNLPFRRPLGVWELIQKRYEYVLSNNTHLLMYERKKELSRI